MNRIFSFPPVIPTEARLLILGSMPGTVSLRMQQYYAHRQNAFWRIMGELVGAGPELAYEQRLERMRSCGIALWDVLQSCQRAGSLDSAIESDSMQPNDLLQLYASQPLLTQVFFNGAKAEASYRRFVLPRLDARQAALCYTRLPSTSPAHAAMPYSEKLLAWRKILAVTI